MDNDGKRTVMGDGGGDGRFEVNVLLTAPAADRRYSAERFLLYRPGGHLRHCTGSHYGHSCYHKHYSLECFYRPPIFLNFKNASLTELCLEKVDKSLPWVPSESTSEAGSEN